MSGSVEDGVEDCGLELTPSRNAGLEMNSLLKNATVLQSQRDSDFLSAIRLSAHLHCYTRRQRVLEFTSFAAARSLRSPVRRR